LKLNPADVVEFFKVVLKYKMIPAYIVCKKSKSDNTVFNLAIEQFGSLHSGFEKNIPHIITAREFNLGLLGITKLRSDIVFKQLDIFDSGGNILNQQEKRKPG
jgi:hypothetical protein